ncbi:MAG: glycerophosphodiester phosphodiesterase family protein, partial [Pseudomonadota bacterium]|nr:glycerophosphodiester phosphodiesterase family protein [Pseudomonadota bacterium]
MAMEFTLPPLIGHRGAARVAPENTLPGLAAAAEAGVRWVELDVKLTADDVAILMHD